MFCTTAHLSTGSSRHAPVPDLGTDPLPYVWPTAVGAGMGEPGNRTLEQQRASDLVAELTGELLAADAFLFAIPMYNFAVPQQVKLWVDLLMVDRRFSRADEPLLAGRPAVLVEARGGGYGPGTPRDGWNHATPWLRQVFGEVLGLDLSVVEAELTLADVNPAMASLRGLADQSLAAAHSKASGHGRSLARRPARAG